MDIKKLWPTISMVALTAIGSNLEMIQAWIAQHQIVSLILGTVSVAIANVTQSPKRSE